MICVYLPKPSKDDLATHRATSRSISFDIKEKRELAKNETILEMEQRGS